MSSASLVHTVLLFIQTCTATKFQSHAPNNKPGWSPSKQNRRCVMINMTSRDSAECSPLKLIRLDPLTGGGAGNGTRWNVQLLGTGHSGHAPPSLLSSVTNPRLPPAPALMSHQQVIITSHCRLAGHLGHLSFSFIISFAWLFMAHNI